MTIHELIAARRTVRQFDPKPVRRPVLEKIVDAGRLAPSAANLQPLEFVLVDDDAVRAELFRGLKWASYIAPDGNPKPGREPRAYIVVLVNTQVRDKIYEYDVGAAVENMLLAGLGDGVAGCWLISFDKAALQEILRLPGHLKPEAVVALGYPAQVSLVETYDGSPRYWQDADGTFHVPKRRLKDVLHLNKY